MYFLKKISILEEFREIKEEDAFVFEVDKDTNIFQIYSNEDYKKLPKIDEKYTIDFEECLRQGIDGIEVCTPTVYREVLSTWDCESIIILNPEIITPCLDLNSPDLLEKYPDYNHFQISEILKGEKQGIDMLSYVNSNMDGYEIHNIRENILTERGIKESNYDNNDYSFGI